MNEELKKLLYTNKDGELTDSYDMGLLDDDEVPWERVKPLLGYLELEPEYSKLEIARLLSAWGEKIGLNYLESLVDNGTYMDKNINPHRLRGYDTTYELILESVLHYWIRYEDRSAKLADKAKIEITPILKKIIKLSNQIQFEIQPLLRYFTRGWPELLPDMKEHLLSIISSESQHNWKIVDCINALDIVAPEVVDELLLKVGKSRADYQLDE